MHQRLGKPIPEPSPIKAPEPKESKENGDKKVGNKLQARKPPIRKTASPKINFVGGTKLTSSGLMRTDGGVLASGVSATSSSSSGISASAALSQDVDMEEGNLFSPFKIHDPAFNRDYIVVAIN